MYVDYSKHTILLYITTNFCMECKGRFRGWGAAGAVVPFIRVNDMQGAAVAYLQYL